MRTESSITKEERSGMCVADKEKHVVISMQLHAIDGKLCLDAQIHESLLDLTAFDAFAETHGLRARRGFDKEARRWVRVWWKVSDQHLLQFICNLLECMRPDMRRGLGVDGMIPDLVQARQIQTR